MKTTLLVIGIIFMLMAVLATPIAIGLGLYDWVAGGLEFKYAVWEAFKSWALMLVVGMPVGYTCYFAGVAYKN